MDSIKPQRIQDDIKEIREELSKVFLLTSAMQVPIALLRLLYDTFRCGICRSTPMKPPIILQGAVKVSSAVNHVWIRGIGKRGSSTHAQIAGNRTYVETCKINGLDDFLTAIALVLEVDSIDHEDMYYLNQLT